MSDVLKNITDAVDNNSTRRGFSDLFADSKAALDKLQANPDTLVVLLDVMLPGYAGFALCRSLRAPNPRIGILLSLINI